MEKERLNHPLCSPVVVLYGVSISHPALSHCPTTPAMVGTPPASVAHPVPSMGARPVFVIRYGVYESNVTCIHDAACASPSSKCFTNSSVRHTALPAVQLPLAAAAATSTAARCRYAANAYTCSAVSGFVGPKYAFSASPDATLPAARSAPLTLNIVQCTNVTFHASALVDAGYGLLPPSTIRIVYVALASAPAYVTVGCAAVCHCPGLEGASGSIATVAPGCSKLTPHDV